MAPTLVSPARAPGCVVVLALIVLVMSDSEGQCSAGDCMEPAGIQEEDDLSLLALTAQVNFRSHRKEALPQEPPPEQVPVPEARARQPSRKHIAVGPFLAQDAAPSSAVEEFEAEEAEEEELLSRQDAEQERPMHSRKEVPRGRHPHHKRLPAGVAPQPVPLPVLASGEPQEVVSAPKLRAAAPAAVEADELAPDDVEMEPGAAWSGNEVFERARHRPHPVAAPVARAPELGAHSPLAEGKLNGGASKALLAGSVVEAPLPLLLIGVVFLAGVGAFLLHEISQRWPPRKKRAKEARSATVATPPIQPGTDSSFLFHVLNCVESDRDHRKAAAPDQQVKGNPKKHDDDSSDDCSECPRPGKEPESEYDDTEEVFGKLREADWALQIAYVEACQRKNETSPSAGSRQQAQPSRSSRTNNEALAALYKARAEALLSSGSEQR